MRNEEQVGGLHAVLARMVWSAAPIVRMHYHRHDDTLVVELVQADVLDEIRVLDHLLVEFDGFDDDALPTTVYLTGVQAAPGSSAAKVAADLLGPEVWTAATALVASGSELADVELAPEEAAARRTCWHGLAARLREHDRTESRLIGVEFVPGRVHAVLTDGAAEVLDEAVVPLDRNDPAAAVEAIARRRRSWPADTAVRTPRAVRSGCSSAAQCTPRPGWWSSTTSRSTRATSPGRGFPSAD